MSAPKAPPPSPAPDTASIALTCFAAWAIPGAGHVLRGQFRKGLIFFAVLVLMDVVGLMFGGRLFPFELSEPLVFLAAASQWMLGAPRLIAAFGGYGQGIVTAAAFEYGNTFLITAGLLNALVVLDACDLASGKKSA